MLSHFSHVQLFVTPWTVASQAPLSMGFPRQEYWSGLPFSSLGDLPNLGIKTASPEFQVNSLPLSHQGEFVFHIIYSLINIVKTLFYTIFCYYRIIFVPLNAFVR